MHINKKRQSYLDIIISDNFFCQDHEKKNSEGLHKTADILEFLIHYLFAYLLFYPFPLQLK